MSFIEGWVRASSHGIVESIAHKGFWIIKLLIHNLFLLGNLHANECQKNLGEDVFISFSIWVQT